ncbi:superoxide dismutase [Mn], mitochondrial [Orussus abietinus]|uniref:superoxide dismutase [Mn], mitochondrial n=1 Tax=Orussus abietinus TaxID=222816 RepID=UPI000626DB3E|nr:superoxide dismutase [Mn], mitochondrial [Orussus abietinus]
MFAAKRAIVSTTLRCKDVAARQKHTLPELPYDYKALEPIICAEIMQLHHSKHHATYVNNLNVAEEKLKDAVAKGDVSTQVALQGAIKFNGGGHLNHSIFWKNLSPSSSKPSDALSKQIQKDFNDFETFKKRLSEATIAIQGSGWGWLGYNPTYKRLEIKTCGNQDPLQATTGLVPLFGIDVWEHAYYLQYKNVRPDYVKAIFDIANWEDVSNRFKEASGC